MANKCQLDLVFTLFFWILVTILFLGKALLCALIIIWLAQVQFWASSDLPLQYSSQISSKAKLRHQLRKDDIKNTIESFQYLSSPPQCDVSATFDSLPDPVQQVFLRFSSLTVCSLWFRKPFRPWLKQRLLWSGDAHTVSSNSKLYDLS